MGFFSNLLVNLGINTSGFTGGLRGASKSADQFAKTIMKSYRSADQAAKRTTGQFNLFAKETKSAFKDVGRIVQGIIISQAFYKMLGDIKAATAAVWEMAKQFESASISFNQFLRDGPKTQRFLTQLENFAAATPFTFQQSVDNARRLLAYGFKDNSLLTVMRTLADASAASGDMETFDRVAKALGQIQTKGRLAQQELLQLTEAGIPAFDILKTKLKLTNDQLAKVGELKIPAGSAIQAILLGMQERYGGAAEQLSHTVQGLTSTIKDNLLLIGKDAIQPLYGSIKNFLQYFSDKVSGMREIMRQSGFGGLIRSLIPAEALPKIQLFVANITILRNVIIQFGAALWPIAKILLETFLTALNLIMPPLNYFIAMISQLLYWLTHGSPIVRTFITVLGGLMIAGMLAKVVTNLSGALKNLFIVKLLTQAVIGLVRALRWLAVAAISNVWAALGALAVGVFVILAMNSKWAADAVTNLGNTINKFIGIDPSKEFMPTMKDNTKTTNEFNQKLGISSDKLDNMGDSAKKAGKKAKDALQSFDEVFNISDKEDENGFEMPDLPAVEVPIIPDVQIGEMETPDFSGVGAGLGQLFSGSFTDGIKNTLTGSTIGAVLGAIIGGIFGGPAGILLGAKIGALAGGLVGVFWESIKKYFSEQASKFCDDMGVVWGYVIDRFKEAFKGDNILDIGKNIIIGIFTGIGAILLTVGDLVRRFVFDPIIDAIKHIFGIESSNTPMQDVGANILRKLVDGFGVAIKDVVTGIEKVKNKITEWFSQLDLKEIGSAILDTLGQGFQKAVDKVKQHLSDVWGKITDWVNGWSLVDLGRKVAEGFVEGFKDISKGVTNAFTSVRTFMINMVNGIIRALNSMIKGLNSAISITVPNWVPTYGGDTWGLNIPTIPLVPEHARGGIFNKEHIARFNEGNRMEAILPVENPSAMAQVRRAIFGGEPADFFKSVMKDIASATTTGAQAPDNYYVGTLIADDRGLRELAKKVNIIKTGDSMRGLNYAK